jgi:hypothetical protein
MIQTIHLLHVNLLLCLPMPSTASFPRTLYPVHCNKTRRFSQTPQVEKALLQQTHRTKLLSPSSHH